MDIVHIELDTVGNVLPPKHDKLLLIDADTIAFAAASTCEIAMDLLPREFYTDTEWEEIISDPDYCDDTNIIYSMDVSIAFSRAREKIHKIMELSGGQVYELFFTGGRDNFRYSVDSKYKANRKSMHVPSGLKELKDMMIAELGGTICTEWEADDEVVCRFYEDPLNTLVCAVDKDVLGSLPHAFNYYESNKYNIDMKFVTNSEQSILRHPYHQSLMGDTSDGIMGIYKVGKVKANKILDSAEQTEEDLWKAVADAYEVAGMSEFDAIGNMRLVRMDQLVRGVGNEWQLKLWLPPKSENSINDIE